MFFVLSKTLGFFFVPSNLIMAFGVLGLGLIFSKRRRVGGWLLASCVAALLICGFSPIGALMLLPLERVLSMLAEIQAFAQRIPAKLMSPRASSRT